MKNYSANFILPLLFAACLLSGCGKKQENPEPETSSVFDDMRYYPQETLKEGTSLQLSEDPAAVWVYSSCITDHGVFFFSEEDHLLKYEEWESGNVYPLCAKSNCLHISSDCTAWFSPSEAWLPTAFYYNGEFLFFELNGETGETVFYRQNLDGSDRQQIFTEKSNFSDGVVYDDDLVYYLTYTTAPDEETETERVNTESTLTYYLNQGNLTTGETKRLSYSWNDTMVYMSLLGKYENQLALRHSVVTGEGEDDWPVVEETLFLLNLDNGEMTGIGQGFSQRNDMFAGDASRRGFSGQ